MAVNAATSTYVNNSSSSKGFSGLASGVDTESMVEELLSGTQSKIDKQEAAKQQLLWKQEIYRNIISQINAFQSKFFSFSSSSNLASSSFWNSMSVLANSSAFKASATSSASTGTSTISVRRLATKSSVTSGMSVSGSLKGSMNTEALKTLTDEQLDGDYTVKFKVGDADVEVDLKDIFVNEDGKTFTQKSTTQLDSAIQKKLQAAFDEAETGVKVTVEDGKVSITHTDFSSYAKNIQVSGESGALGLERLGLTADTGGTRSSVKNNNIETVTYTLTGKVDAVPKMTFSVTLDDLKKDVSIDLRQVMDEDGNIDDAAFRTQLQAALDKAHGTNQIKVKNSASGGFTLEVSTGRKVDVTGTEEAMDVLGMKSGASNRISLSSTLSELNMGSPLRGDDYRFTINGVEFHFTGDTALIDVMDVINQSDAGVRMVYRAQDDKFVLEAKEYGAGKQIVMSQSKGNFLTSVFGMTDGLTVGELYSKNILPSTYEPLATKGKSFQVAMEDDLTGEQDEDGNYPQIPDKSTMLSAITYNNADDPDDPDNGKSLDEILGVSDMTLEDLEDEGYNFSFDDEGNFTITKNVDTATTTLKDLGYDLGDDYNDVPLADLGTESDGKIRYYGGYLVLDGYWAEEETNADILASLNTIFGEGQAIGKEPSEFFLVDGQNSEVMIDGVITERSSNNFTVNGINYDISDITGSYSDPILYQKEEADGIHYYIDAEMTQEIVGFDPLADDALEKLLEAFPDLTQQDLVLVDGQWVKFTGTSTTVTVKQDTDAIVNSIKEFIDEYNVLIKTLNDYLDEDTNYRDYQPLTSAQKAEMSEREIELWEQKAKEGLLHNDTAIQSFLQQMRTALYQKPEGAKYALYELGIETGEWEMKGQLTFSINGETQLRSLLENDPSGVASLFTTVNGLGTTLNDILKSTASTSSGSPGTLVQIAGLKDSDTTSSIYNQLKKIDEKIELLKLQYESEKTRYWNQFNTMEQMISNMNTQSAYLAQMMGLSY